MKIIITLFIVFLSGCATFTRPASYDSLGNNGTYWMSYDSSRRGAFIDLRDGKIRSCAEQAPDVALSFANTVKANATSNGVTGGIDTSFAATALALAGRDDLVLLEREALFRICEANLNGSVANSDVGPLMEALFKHVEVMSINKKEQANATLKTLQTLQVK
ncbi:hypothetical protein [Methylomonas sp. AM2-LC]|uniref:hypothetical protein n=1 Tax=Methylomonas sp. AM2-LC TaxID=3153301 RepID=UPI0032633050